MGKVVVTGFGPFGSFAHNPSSDVVDQLEKLGIEGFDGTLVVEKISVEYNCVKDTVPELWKKHEPILMVHIGAHPFNKCVKLEQQSFRDGYCRYDVKGCVPVDNVCVVGPDPVLTSDIDCEKIATTVTEKLGYSKEKVEIVKSNDPGRYLCGFSYFLSLSQKRDRSLFIHVPPFDEECTLDVVTNVVREILAQILDTEHV